MIVWRIDALGARLFAVLAWLLLIAPNLAPTACCADSPGHPGLCFLWWLWLLLLLLLLLPLVVLGRIPCGDDGVAVRHDLVVGWDLELRSLIRRLRYPARVE